LDKYRVLIIIGTRPEAIKLAPVIMQLGLRQDIFLSKVCVSAQHRQMMDQVLEIFNIKPDYDLNIMLPGQTLAQVTSRAIEGIDRVIGEMKPDLVIVQGDTATAFCGALAAYYHKVKVCHVEAGLRTEDKFAPFPEEINRRLVSRLTDYHFAPTLYARKTLIRENIVPSSIFVTGNTVIDALIWVRDKVRNEKPELPLSLIAALTGRTMILVTGHRRESFGEGFGNICSAIRQVADAFLETVFIYPVHLNPNVREPVNRILKGHNRIHLIEPLPYDQFVWLMDRAEIVLTDSGGIQEEAPCLGKPVLVMREKTERPEGVQAGNARLVGVNKEQIVNALVDLLEHPTKRKKMARVNNPYGDGHAAKRIISILEKRLRGD
jgi:UDP-N-acetylglucosamine 2-epimerase (non-hydrolysing)